MMYVEFSKDPKYLRRVGQQIVAAAEGDADAINALVTSIGPGAFREILDRFATIRDRLHEATSGDVDDLRGSKHEDETELESISKQIEKLLARRDKVSARLDSTEHEIAMRDRRFAEVPGMFTTSGLTDPIVFALEEELRAAGFLEYCRRVRGIQCEVGYAE